MPRLFLATGLTLLPASFLIAHEGHGHTGSGGLESGPINLLRHYVVEPQHAWVLAALIVVAALAFAYRWFANTESASSNS